MKIDIPLAELEPSEYRKIAKWIQQVPIKNPVRVSFTIEELLLLAQILADMEA